MSDHEWDQMSVMERCEVLRARLERIERDSTDIEKFTRYVDGRLIENERRVLDLEANPNVLGLRGWTREMVEEFNRWKPSDEVREKLASMNKNGGAGWGAEWCDSRELARLRRIEAAAARTLVHIDMNPATLDISPAVRDLRAALDSEPKR